MKCQYNGWDKDDFACVCVLISKAIAITFQERIQREVLCEDECCGSYLCFLDVKCL